MRWSAADLRGTVAVLDEWWALLSEGVSEDTALQVRPAEIDALASVSSPAVADVERVLAALSHAGREFARMGYAVKAQSGSVRGVFVGDGGVPKHPVAAAEVSRTGLTGDRQRTRKYHGRVWQAVCLWSAEVVAELQAEGHPVFPGGCGENLSLAGIAWADLRAGARMRVGSALLELSVPTEPCRQIRPFFDGGAIRRVDHYRHPGAARWYASVLEPGAVAVGDEVTLEPAA